MAGESAREVAARSRAKAERLMRHAEMYDCGADGEAATAAILTALPPEWVSMHDVRWPGRRRANIDHIVVGPGGIFVVDSKNWSGRISVENNSLRQNGRSRETAVASCADAALAVSELLGPHAAAVSPVLCFVRGEPVTGWARDVMICSTVNLAPMLLSRPVVLAPEQLAEAWTRLDMQLRPARGEVRPVPPISKRPPRRPGASGVPGSRRRASTRRARQPSLGRFLVTIAMLIGLLIWGPQLAGAFGNMVSNQITKSVETRQPCPTTTMKPLRKKVDSTQGTASSSDC